MRNASYDHLGPRVFSADAPHDFTAFFWTDCIHAVAAELGGLEVFLVVGVRSLWQASGVTCVSVAPLATWWMCCSISAVPRLE